MANDVPATQSATTVMADEGISLSVGADLSVFGIKLIGALSNEADGRRILIMPGSGTMKQSVTLAEVLTAAKMESKISAIDSALRFVGLSAENMSIDVNQVFFYHSSFEADKGATDATCEYAFSIGISNADPAPQSFDIVTINNVFVSLWNTKRESVKSTLGLVDFEKALASLQ